MSDPKPTKPNCYECIHRRPIPGDAHSACAAVGAYVLGREHGIRNGWFLWPFNFDPIWLDSCDSFVSSAAIRSARGEA